MHRNLCQFTKLLILFLFSLTAHVTVLADESQPAVQVQKPSSWVPSKPITITAPSGPGGGWDQTARFLQHAIRSEDLSPVPITVVNKGGAGGMVGLAELIDRNEEDPYKLMIGGLTMTSAIIMNNGTNTLNDTTPIARLTSEFQIIAVPVDSPFQDLSSLLKAFRERPQTISWGGGAAGSADHLFAALVVEKTGGDPKEINYVAFSGGGEAAAALMGGQVSAGVSGFAEWSGLIEAGRIRVLAISSSERSVSQNIPTLKELGIDLVFENWRCIVAPPNISKAEELWLTELVTNTVKSETWRQVLENNKWEDSFISGNAFKDFVRSNIEETSGVLNRLGLGANIKRNGNIGAFFFPKIIGAGLLISLIGFAFQKYRNPASSIKVDSGHPIVTKPEPSTKKMALVSLTLVAYLAAINFLGFLFSTFVCFTLLAHFIGSSSLWRDTLVGIALTITVKLIFTHVLHVDIP